jgi:chromosome segregation ATPase
LDCRDCHQKLEQQQAQQQQQPADSAVPPASVLPPALQADQKNIAELSAKCELLQHQVTELKAARDVTASREGRVRHNLYRLSAGMMTVQQLLHTLEDDVNGRQGDQEEMIIKQQAAEQGATVSKLQEQLEDSKHSTHVKQQGNDATISVTTVSSVEVQSLKEKVASLEQICRIEKHRCRRYVAICTAMKQWDTTAATPALY